MLLSVVIVTLDPATRVNVSVVESAVTVPCPATAKLANKFCAPLAPASAQLNTPEPFVVNCCPDEPSPSGKTNVVLPVSVAGALMAV